MTPSSRLYEPEVLESEIKDALRHISNRKAAGIDDIPIELLKAGGEEAVKVLTNMCNCVWKKKEWPLDWKKISVCPDLQERRQEGMWKLSHNCLDLARKQGTLESTTEKVGGVPDTRTSDRASWFQKRNEGPHCKSEMDDGKSQRTSARPVYVLHRLQEGFRLCRP